MTTLIVLWETIDEDGARGVVEGVVSSKTLTVTGMMQQFIGLGFCPVRPRYSSAWVYVPWHRVIEVRLP